jgi:NAD(P)-dependent dehydrogenase (short-subunit alcohol dehydrogenase family)
MIPIDLQGRKAITGNDSGLGAVTAKLLAQAGADIAMDPQSW